MSDQFKKEIFSHVYRIDKFAVPNQAKDEFLAKVLQTHALLKTIPGFRQDFVLEQASENDKFNIVTIVEWENEEAVALAKTAVSTMHQQINFNPQETIARLGITADIGTFKQIAIH
jgi:antibiotic biosynthesis monooxygenase (ABM) superfamily enzyme